MAYISLDEVQKIMGAKQNSVPVVEKPQTQGVQSMAVPSNSMPQNSGNYGDRVTAFKNRNKTTPIPQVEEQPVVEQPQNDLSKWLGTDYKMSKADKEQAKQYVNDWYNNNGYAGRGNFFESLKNRQANADYLANLSPEEAQKRWAELEQVQALENKMSKGASFAGGLIDALHADDIAGGLMNLLSKGSAKSDKGLAEAYKNQSNVLQNTVDNAQTQNPLSFGAGKLAGTMAEYNLANQALGSIPALARAKDGISTALGGGKLGNLAGGVAIDMIPDLALDTLPTELENIRDGMSAGDVAKDTAMNIGTNLAFNTVGGALSDIVLPSLAKNLGKNADDVAENVLKNADDTLNPTDILKQDEQAVSDAITKQNEAVQNIQDLTEKLSEAPNSNVDVMSSNVADSVKPTDIVRTDANNAIRNNIDNISKELNFSSNEAKAEYDNAVKEMLDIVDKIENSNDHKEIFNAYDELSNATKKVDSLLDNATITRNVDNGKAAAKKEFYDLTRGTVIKIPPEVRAEFPNMSMTDWNNLSYKLFGKDGKKLRFTTKDNAKGLGADVLLNENENQALYALLGLDATNSSQADMLSSLKSYMESMIGDETEKVTESARDIVGSVLDDDLFGNLISENNGRYKELRNAANQTSNIPTTPNIPENASIGNDLTGDIGESKVVTNTANRSEIDRGIPEDDLQRIKEYSIHHESDSMSQALDNLKTPQDYARMENDYVSGAKSIEGNVDVDTSMLILSDLKNQYEQALASGNTDLANQINARRSKMLMKLREAGTEGGQRIQAFAKWTRTAEGANVNGERILNERGKNWASRNQKEAGVNKKLAEALKQMGYDGSMDTEPVVKSLDDIKAEVRNTLGREFSSIQDQFSDADVDYLANMINEGASTKELTDMLNSKMASGHFGLTPETQARVTELFESVKGLDEGSKERVEAEMEAFKLIANETMDKASFADKFEAWRYMAMLGNPKTMLRNAIGNKLFGFTTGVSNNLAAAMEAVADRTNKAFGGNGIQRTKAILNPVADSSLIKAASNDADVKSYARLAGNKYTGSGVRSTIESSRDVWDSKAMKKLDELVSAGISDDKAVKSKYGTSLAGYLKANGMDESIFEAEARYSRLNADSKTRLLSKAERAEMDALKPQIDALEKGRDFAVKQAEYATFHEQNDVADALTKLSSKLNNSESKVANVTGKVIEGLVPFKKTPLNVLRSGIDYSPIGVVNSIGKTGKFFADLNKADSYIDKKGVAKQAVRAADVIQSWSESLTGTGLAVLGAYLFSKGILTSSNKNEEYQDSLEGIQNYAIKFTNPVNGKDYTYTVDWLAPAIMPLMLGAETLKMYTGNGGDEKSFFEMAKDKEFIDMIEKSFNSTMTLANPIMETSMLSGLQDALTTAANAVKNGDGQMLGVAGMNALTSYAQQALPTAVGQVARTLDNTRRSNYTEKQGLAGTIDKQQQKLENKIPGLSTSNNPYVDTYGRELQNGVSNTGNKALDFLPNLAYQALSPGYLQEVNTTEADNIARSVYENSNDPKVFADWASYASYADGSRMNTDDFYKYSKERGQAVQQLYETVGSSDFFQKLTPDKQADVLKELKTLSGKIGEQAIEPGRGLGNYDKLYNAWEKKGAEGVAKLVKENQANKALKETFESIGVNVNKETKNLYKKGGEKALKEYEKTSSALEKYGFEYSDKANAYYKKYGNNGLPVLQKVKNAGKVEEKVKYLETLDIPTSQKVDILRYTQSSLAKKAGTTDEEIWKWYSKTY